MDVVTVTPDTYTPSVDETGNYIDNIPIIKHGIYCLCGSRKDKSYDDASKFYTHTKTKKHQKWLTSLNQNRANYYVEMTKYKDIVDTQQKIISQMEKQLQSKIVTIDYLTDQLINRIKPSSDDSLGDIN